MNILFWRHAKAQEPSAKMRDFDRPLTPKGEKQAKHMAAWLQEHMPKDTLVLASPALRCVQTVQALGLGYKTDKRLGIDGSADQMLQLLGWPEGLQQNACVLVVGHQPTLGQAVARLLYLSEGECEIAKGSLWWLQAKEAGAPAKVLTVQSPKLL